MYSAQISQLMQLQQPLVLDVGTGGCWLARVDTKSRKPGALSVPIHPLHIAEASDTKWRFSAAFNNYYQQPNPVVLITGERPQLQEMELKAKQARSLHTNTDCASTCVAVNSAQLTQLVNHTKDKQFTAAWDLLYTLAAFSDPTAITQRRGRKIAVDSRLTMLDSTWIQRCVLVCIMYYPDLIKVMLPGGKREPLLTTQHNMMLGGESTVEAAVREVCEETGLVIQEEQLQSLCRKCGMEFFHVSV